MTTIALTATKIASKSKIVISWFSYRRVVVGSVVFGLFAAAESIAQSLGITAAYPNVAQRAKAIYGLANDAALGLFYGDRHANIITPAGYMVYRILPILALVGAIWALMATTKMLRGQEENGRWELILSGSTSARKATLDTLIGLLGGVATAFIALFIILSLSGHSPKLNFTTSGIVYYCLATVSGALVAVGIGATASQLMATKRQASIYGSMALVLFFILRSVGNVVSRLAWLKNLTPFGWIDKLHPFSNTQPIWFLPILILAVAFCCLAVWLATKRDLNDSYIADSGSSKPRLKLLNTQLGFDFRLSRSIYIAWLIGSVAFAGLVASIDKSVASSLASSSSLTKTISRLTGNPYSKIEIAYLSAAGYLVMISLMIMAATAIGAARNEEASGRLDNIVSGKVSRQGWLCAKLGLLLLAAVAVSSVANLTVWAIAHAQGINVSFDSLVFGGLNILGPVVFLTGAGALFMGLKPRIASIVMYILVAWSFTIDIIISAVKLNPWFADSSLLHYVALEPAASPSWRSFSILIGLGVVLMLAGVSLFASRDLVYE